MTTHGKHCDFDFYVASFDADNRYAGTEPMSSGLSLLEAVSEFYKRCGRYPSGTNIMLGVEYTTSRRDLMARLTDEYGLERCKVILANEYYGNSSGMLTPGTAAYLDEACDRHDDRFNINAPPLALESLTAAVREIEGLSETENKILQAGLVNGDREQVQSHSALIKSEIGHHNDLENNGLVPEDQWSL